MKFIKYAKKVSAAIPNENIFTNTFLLLWIGKVKRWKSLHFFLLLFSFSVLDAVHEEINLTLADDWTNLIIYYSDEVVLGSSWVYVLKFKDTYTNVTNSRMSSRRIKLDFSTGISRIMHFKRFRWKKVCLGNSAMTFSQIWKLEIYISTSLFGWKERKTARKLFGCAVLLNVIMYLEANKSYSS